MSQDAYYNDDRRRAPLPVRSESNGRAQEPGLYRNGPSQAPTRGYDDRTRLPPPIHMGGGYGPPPHMLGMRDDYSRGGAGKRRRELSPPTSGYRDDSRTYPPPNDHRFSPYDRQAFAAQDGRRSLDAPNSLNYQVTQRYFTDWFSLEYPRLASNSTAIEKAWKQYLIDFKRRQIIKTFEEYQKASWFREKYDPADEFVEMRERLKAKGREDGIDMFLSDLEKGRFEGVVMDYGSKKTEGSESDESGVRLLNDDGTPRDISPDCMFLPEVSYEIVLKSIKPDISRAELEERLSTLEGFDHLALTEPNPEKKMHRIGFAVFNSEEDTFKAMEALKDWSIRDFVLPFAKADNAKPVRYRATPASMNESSRIAKDLEQIRRLALALEREAGDSRGSVAIEQRHAKINSEGGIVSEAKTTKQTLDLYLCYLRKAFHTCFYCLGVFNFREELMRRCPKHVRLPWEAEKQVRSPALETAWIESFDERLPLLTDRDSCNITDFGGEDPDEALHKLCASHHKIEDEGKFRCKFPDCNKLFSALKFVEKHIMTKHPELIRDKFDKMNYINNYVLDPLRYPATNKLENFTPTARKEFENQGKPAPSQQRNTVPKLGSLDGGLGSRLGPIPSMMPELLPIPMALGSMPMLGDNKRRRQDLGGGRIANPPPPPQGAKLDPRASRGARSYADLDGPAGGNTDGDVVLKY